MKTAPQIVAEIGTKLNLSRIPNYPKQCKGVKIMLDEGYTDEEIVSVYMSMKRDRFWQDKFLPMTYVASNIESKIGKPGQDKMDWDKWAEEHGNI